MGQDQFFSYVCRRCTRRGFSLWYSQYINLRTNIELQQEASCSFIMFCGFNSSSSWRHSGWLFGWIMFLWKRSFSASCLFFAPALFVWILFQLRSWSHVKSFCGSTTGPSSSFVCICSRNPEFRSDSSNQLHSWTDTRTELGPCLHFFSFFCTIFLLISICGYRIPYPRDLCCVSHRSGSPCSLESSWRRAPWSISLSPLRCVWLPVFGLFEAALLPVEDSVADLFPQFSLSCPA